MRNKMTVSARSLSSGAHEHEAVDLCTCPHRKPKAGFDPVKELDSVAKDWGIDKSVLLKMTAGISLLKKYERDEKRVLSRIESEILVLKSLLSSKTEPDNTELNLQIDALKGKIEALEKGLAGLLKTNLDCQTACTEAEA